MLPAGFWLKVSHCLSAFFCRIPHNGILEIIPSNLKYRFLFRDYFGLQGSCLIDAVSRSCNSEGRLFLNKVLRSTSILDWGKVHSFPPYPCTGGRWDHRSQCQISRWRCSTRANSTLSWDCKGTTCMRRYVCKRVWHSKEDETPGLCTSKSHLSSDSSKETV